MHHDSLIFPMGGAADACHAEYGTTKQRSRDKQTVARPRIGIRSRTHEFSALLTGALIHEPQLDRRVTGHSIATTRT